MSSNNWRHLKSDGLSFKKTQKVKPLKKIPETDAIFENLAKANTEADQNPKTLRISLDSKARVKVGNLSREGKSRALEPPQADDHDHQWSEVLVPMGILDVQGGKFSIYFGTSAETSDFIVEGNHPQIHLIEETYQKGIIVPASELKVFRQFWQCSETLPKWDVAIAPP